MPHSFTASVPRSEAEGLCNGRAERAGCPRSGLFAEMSSDEFRIRQYGEGAGSPGFPM